MTALTGNGPHALGSMPVQYGDFIQLHAVSTFLKPEGRTQSRDMQHEGQDLDVLAKCSEGKNFIGNYYKPNGVTRLAVPPIGENAKGQFVAAVYQLVDPHETQANPSTGRSVKYGDPVVLVDENGNALNNKVGGFFEGYLGPKPRGKTGECFMSFHLPGKERLPMQYGEPDVFIQIDDSHRYRSGYNNRLSNYKTYSSKVVGGYVVCDGSGTELLFTLARSTRSHRRSTANPISKEDVPAMNCVSILRNKKEVAVLRQPTYGGVVRIADVRQGDRLRLTFAKTNAVDHCGKKLMPVRPTAELSAKTFSPGSHWTLLKVSCPVPFMVRLAWHYEDEEPFAEVVAGPEDDYAPSVADWATGIVKLILVYVISFAAFVVAEPILASRLSFASTLLEFVPLPVLGALYACYVTDTLSPRFARGAGNQAQAQVSRSKAMMAKTRSASFNAKVLCLTIRPEEIQTTEARRLWKSTATLMEDVSDTEEEEEEEETFYDKFGTDEQGHPKHPAFKRFLNGEKGNMKVALKRWNVTRDWRQSNDVDHILDQPHKHFEVIKSHYPHYFYSRAKDGYVVYIECPGQVKMKPMRKAGLKLKDLLWHYLYITEFMWTALEPAEKGRTITILDMKGIGLWDFAGEVVDFVKKCAAFTGDHYPERSFRIFVINVPRWFMTIYNVVKKWVAEETRKKIVIARSASSYQPKLLELIDADQLPVKYGGTCTIPLAESPLEKILRNNVYKHLARTGTPLTGPTGHPVEGSPGNLKVDESLEWGVTHMADHIPDP